LSTGTFASLIRSNASRFTRTRLFTQILEGLAVLHGHGIAHRDIKPGNLTVTAYDPPDAQIIDFGCATFQSKILYDRPGTIPYLAPEQAEGLYHGRSVDYWSIALVGLELMQYRMRGVKVTAEIYKDMHKWLANQPDDAMVNCCKGMLQWEPAARLTAADALRGCLAQFRDHAIEDGKRTLQNLDRQVKRRTSADFR
jgi:serine/threonine protein kinase